MTARPSASICRSSTCRTLEGLWKPLRWPHGRTAELARVESQGGQTLALIHPVESMSNNHGGRREPSHARIYAKWRKLPAFKSLSHNALLLLISVLWDHRKNGPNIWPMTDELAALRLSCSTVTAGRAVRELLEKGWFRVERKGRTTGNRSTRGRVVSLSQEPTDARKAEQWRFEKWREPDDCNA